MKFRCSQFVVDAFAIDHKIRHAVSGLNIKSFISAIFAERAMAIIDTDLREQRENEMLYGSQAEDGAGDYRQDIFAQESEPPLRAGSELKHAVGGLQQMPGVFEALI